MQRAFPETQLVATEGDDVITVVNAAPVRWPADPPPGGWDWAIAAACREGADAVCALAVTVAPEHRGRRVSRRALEAIKSRTRELGFRKLFVPVRPPTKPPDEPMESFLTRHREDGLHVDPWLRQHQRLGAELLGVCPRSMVMAGTVDAWREWTGEPLARSGAHNVPDLIAVLEVDLDADRAVYVEPNVWMEHPLG